MLLRESYKQIYATNIKAIDDVDPVILNLIQEEREIQWGCTPLPPSTQKVEAGESL